MHIVWKSKIIRGVVKYAIPAAALLVLLAVSCMQRGIQIEDAQTISVAEQLATARYMGTRAAGIEFAATARAAETQNAAAIESTSIVGLAQAQSQATRIMVDTLNTVVAATEISIESTARSDIATAAWPLTATPEKARANLEESRAVWANRTTMMLNVLWATILFTIAVIMITIGAMVIVLIVRGHRVFPSVAIIVNRVLEIKAAQQTVEAINSKLLKRYDPETGTIIIEQIAPPAPKSVQKQDSPEHAPTDARMDEWTSSVRIFLACTKLAGMTERSLTGREGKAAYTTPSGWRKYTQVLEDSGYIVKDEAGTRFVDGITADQIIDLLNKGDDLVLSSVKGAPPPVSLAGLNRVPEPSTV